MTDYKSKDLEPSRERLLRARAAAANLIGGPNLSLSVNPPNRSPAKRFQSAHDGHQRDRDEFRVLEKSSEQVDREVVGEEIRLAGRMKALPVAKSNIGRKGGALKLGANFTIPAARSERLANKGGATSFHFKHEPVVKATNRKGATSGMVLRKNAAKDHAKYLERDGAVARVSSLDGEATNGQRDTALPAPDNLGAMADGKAAEGGRYIEREEALAHWEDGVPVIFSNISADPEERQEFWALVEKHETEPSPDSLGIIISRAPDFWAKVRDDPSCPAKLALSIATANPDKEFIVETGDNREIRVILERYGWKPPAASGEDETLAQMKGRKAQDLVNARGARCIDGRGGRIQIRVVGELPCEVSQDARIRILKNLRGNSRNGNCRTWRSCMRLTMPTTRRTGTFTSPTTTGPVIGSRAPLTTTIPIANMMPAPKMRGSTLGKQQYSKPV